jgi:hypothetical protein
LNLPCAVERKASEEGLAVALGELADLLSHAGRGGV